MSYIRLAGIVSSLIVAVTTAASAQARFDPAAAIAAQRTAMKSLSMMDGVWRGPAWTIVDDGTRHDVIQTERIGPFLDGSVKVTEGRSHDVVTGAVGFNALGTISYDQGTNTYMLRSYAQGRSGDFKLMPTADGYVWEINAGPATIRYTAVIKNGTWREVGDRIMAGRDPVRFFEMNLTRVGDTDWPAAGAIPRQ